MYMSNDFKSISESSLY